MDLITHQDLFTSISPSASFILQRIVKAILLDYHGLQNPVFGWKNDNVAQLILDVSYVQRTSVSDIEIKTPVSRMMKFSTMDAHSEKKLLNLEIQKHKKPEFPTFRRKESNLQIFVSPFVKIFTLEMCNALGDSRFFLVAFLRQLFLL